MTKNSEVDALIRQQLDSLLGEVMRVRSLDGRGYYEAKTKLLAIMDFISPSSSNFEDLKKEINRWNNNASEYLLEYVKAVKHIFESGLYRSAVVMAENNVSFDYMSQAEGLLGEGVVGRADHVPAAVLAGAVLEDALRRLCVRNDPPIPLETEKSDGNLVSRTTDSLIADLQKADVFNKAKADQLGSWTKIRNSAAHWKPDEFTRSDVELMVAGIKIFLADYL